MGKVYMRGFRTGYSVFKKIQARNIHKIRKEQQKNQLVLKSWATDLHRTSLHILTAMQCSPPAGEGLHD